MTQRDQQRQRTRTAILRTAAAQFDARGYLGTSIRDIAGALDLTVGAIFFHFKTKDGLAKEIIAGYYTHWDALIGKARRRPGSRLDALVWLSLRIAESYTQDVQIQAAVRLIRERSVIDESLPMPYLDWIKVTTDLLKKARAEDELADGVNVDLIAYQLVCSWFGNQHISTDLAERKDLLQRLVDMWSVYLPLLNGAPTNLGQFPALEHWN